MRTKANPVGARHPARLAVIVSVALLVGLLAGPGSAANGSGPDTPYDYACRLPSGAGTAKVVVSTSFPKEGEVGRPFSSGAVTVDVALAHDAVASLLPAGTTHVQSTATLAVRVAHNGRTADATWSGLVAPTTPVPSEGDGRLTHAGEVPSVTVATPGDVTLTAGGLTLELTPVASDQPTESPQAAESPGGTAEPVSLACEPTPGQTGLLATVSVPGSRRPSPGASGTGEPRGPGDLPGTGIQVQPRAETPGGETTCSSDIPEGDPDSSDAPPPPPGGPLGVTKLPFTSVCAYAVGLATVRKQNGAMIINDPAKHPALMNVWANKFVNSRSRNAPGGFYGRNDSIGSLKLPDAESTFLSFGFTPVTAKVSFDNGPVSISTGTIGVSPNRVNFAVVSLKQSLRIHDVKVNGTPWTWATSAGPALRSRSSFGAASVRTEHPARISTFWPAVC